LLTCEQTTDGEKLLKSNTSILPVSNRQYVNL